MEWKEENRRFFVLTLPLVGAVLGGLWALLFTLLSFAPNGLRGTLMTLGTLSLTGGLHMDGFMDTCDAFFSRADRQTRLNILSDPHAGAFAVMGCVALMLLRRDLFTGLSCGVASGFSLFPIPILSRIGAALLWGTLPFARQDGLARTLGAGASRAGFIWLMVGAAAVGALTPWTALAGLAVFLPWRLGCRSVFGGITGDLLGAFIEVSETAMLGALLCT